VYRYLKVGERTRRSVAASTCSSIVLPFSLPYAIATLIRREYAGLLAAASNNDGFVVASCASISFRLLYDYGLTLILTCLGLVDVNGCPREIRCTADRKNLSLHSKSPESETTTVPVCLRWSREVVMSFEMIVRRLEKCRAV